MRSVVKVVVAFAVCTLVVLGLGAAASASPGRVHHLHHPQKTITVHGTSSGKYRLALWKRDTVHNCVANSHGSQVRHYFAHTRCHGMTRWQYTTSLDGRRVVLEIEAVAVGRHAGDQNGSASAARLVHALRSGHCNGLDDLLRAGYRIPPAGSRIPARDVSNIFHEDGGVAVFDAWYAHGHTAAHNHRLEKLEHQLYLSAAMS